jgi:Family of unknown function (DUF6545)
MSHDRPATWRERRHARKEFEERADRLCATLPFPPGRLSLIHDFVELVAEQQNLPIERPRAVPIKPGKACGGLAVTDTGISIVYDQKADWYLRCLIIFHQLAHVLLDHFSFNDPDAAPMVARLFPSLNPKLVRAFLARGSFGDRKEAEAEALATRLLQRALEGPPTIQPHDPLQAARRWRAHYRTCRRLSPLWRTMVQAEPTVRLRGALTGSPWSGLLPQAWQRPAATSHRRIVEILSAKLKLWPWMDQEVADIARDVGRRAGLAGDRLEVAVEAASLAAAARAKTRYAAIARERDCRCGLTGDRLEEAVEDACLAAARAKTGEVTPAASSGPTCAALMGAHRDRARWLQIAGAFTGPIVQTTLAEHERRTSQDGSGAAATVSLQQQDHQYGLSG